MTIRRIGIMTGGGDCPGLNPVIRAATATAIRQYGWQVLGIEDAFSGLIDLEYRSPHGNQWLTLDSVADIFAKGGTILGTSNRSDPFRFVAEVDGKRVETDVFDRVLSNFHKIGLDALISVGGDGSMAIAQKAIERGLTQVVGVPKTIDNDLAATDYTFGFDSAVQVATEAIDRLRDTADSHDRVMLVELMGRDAGFIALHAGVAGGAHVILLPEIPYHIDSVVAAIRKRQRERHPASIVVVAEGARPAGGDVSLLGSREPGAMRRLFGAAFRVAEELEARVALDLRVTVLGHVQRGGSPSNFDRVLGARMGEEAVHLIARGEFGRMVTLRGTAIESVPILTVVGQTKRVDPGGQLMRCARSLGIDFGEP